jgi:hypothetical protein
MKLDDKKIKYILQNLSLSDTERNWLKYSIKKHGSAEAASGDIEGFLRNKLANLELAYKQLENDEEEINKEIKFLQIQIRKEIEVTAVNNYRNELVKIKKFEDEQKKRLADIYLQAENSKRKIKIYREKARKDQDQKQINDIRQKLK